MHDDGQFFYASAFYSFSDLGILALTEAQDELVSIKLRKLKGLTGHGLDHISSPSLEYVDLRDCTHVSLEGNLKIYKKIMKYRKSHQNSNIRKHFLYPPLK